METAENGMKIIPKFIEIRDKKKTGSVLHRYAPGNDCNTIKAWMERQPENCRKSSTQKVIKDVFRRKLVEELPLSKIVAMVPQF